MDNNENEILENNDNIQNASNENLSSFKRGTKSNRAIPERLRRISTGHTYRNNQSNKKNNSDSKSSTGEEKNNAANISENDKQADASNLKNKMAQSKQKNNNLLSRIRKSKKKNDQNHEEDKKEESSSDENTDSSDSSEEISAIAKKIKKIKRIAIIVAALFPFFLILLVLLTVGAAISRKGLSFSLKEFGTSEFETVYDEDSPYYKDEIAYYEKLKALNDVYVTEYNDEKAVDYIHSVISYYYYQGEFDVDEDLDEDEEDYDAIIDYAKMTNMIDVVDSLIPKSNNIDYSVNGDFYNNLKNSLEIKNYYKELLKYQSIDDILSDIFELGQNIDIKEDFAINDTYIPNNAVTNLDKNGNVINRPINDRYISSSTGQNNSSSKNNTPGGNKTTTKNGGTKTSDNDKNKDTALTFKEYLSGVIYANLSNEELGQDEKIKALAIAYTTNIMAKNNLAINAQIVTINNKEFNYCSVKDGCSYSNKSLVSGSGKREDGNNVSYGGKYYYKAPLSTSMINNIDTIINNIYGNVLVNSLGNITAIDMDKILRIDITNYQDMLSRAYPELTIRNIIENNYTGNLDYGPRRVSTQVIFYDQNDYTEYAFCGRSNCSNKRNANIKQAGCGATAMAIVISTYKNSNKFDPIYMSEKAKNGKYCGCSISGTNSGFFGNEAKANGYKYRYISKGEKKKTSNQQLILSNLSKGNLVVALMTSGKFAGTSSGHYIVLGGIDPANKKIYVYDPNNRSNKKNRNSGNGWYSFNDVIIKQASFFYIIQRG